MAYNQVDQEYDSDAYTHIHLVSTVTSPHEHNYVSGNDTLRLNRKEILTSGRQWKMFFSDFVLWAS